MGQLFTHALPANQRRGVTRAKFKLAWRAGYPIIKCVQASARACMRSCATAGEPMIGGLQLEHPGKGFKLVARIRAKFTARQNSGRSKPLKIMSASCAAATALAKVDRPSYVTNVVAVMLAGV